MSRWTSISGPKWIRVRCLNCGYVTPPIGEWPDACLNCGADGETHLKDIDEEGGRP